MSLLPHAIRFEPLSRGSDVNNKCLCPILDQLLNILSVLVYTCQLIRFEHSHVEFRGFRSTLAGQTMQSHKTKQGKRRIARRCCCQQERMQAAVGDCCKSGRSQGCNLEQRHADSKSYGAPFRRNARRISLCMRVTRLACRAQRLASSNR